MQAEAIYRPPYYDARITQPPIVTPPASGDNRRRTNPETRSTRSRQPPNAHTHRCGALIV